MHAFELDVMHKPPLVLGASLNPSSTVAKGAADRVRLSTSFCNCLGEPSKTTPESMHSTSMMRALRRPTSLDGVYSESTTTDEPRFD